MELEEILATAWSAVQAAKIPKELQEVALSHAIQLASKGTATPHLPSGPLGDGTDNGPDDAHLAKLAKAIGLDGNKIEGVFQFHEGDLQVVADIIKVADSVKGQTQGIALLVVGGRTISGLDSGAISESVVRNEVRRHGVYNRGNHANYMRATTNWFNINGVGADAKYTIKPQGRAAFKELCSRLAS